MIIRLNNKSGAALALLAILLLMAAVWLIQIHKKSQAGNLQESELKVLTGDYINWYEVQREFPKFAEATVIDVDSQLSFRIQRRGGSRHADVQPLTSADSAIMKKIYNNNWTWKRKAIVLKLDNGQMIAASMNGMPHGQGAINDNNFNGHFCIHFKNSKTHGSNKEDLAHQLMIWKAANILDQQLAILSPQESIAVFITAIDQDEIKIAERLIDKSEGKESLINRLKDINSIKPERIKELEENRFRVDIKIIYKEGQKEIRESVTVNMIKKESFNKIEAISLTDWLQKENPEEVETIKVFTMEEDWD